MCVCVSLPLVGEQQEQQLERVSCPAPVNCFVLPFFGVPVSFTDLTDSSPQTYRSVARRKTDLMPTLPSPRDGMQFGSRSSLTSASHTPRSPGI